MIGSIERLRRRIQVRNLRKLFSLAPMLLLVIGVPTRPDPIAKRGAGAAGVLPIPGSSVTPSAANMHLDAIADARRDTRAERGRVLYGTGRAPRDTATARTLRKHPCPEQRVVQGRNAGVSPNS